MKKIVLILITIFIVFFLFIGYKSLNNILTSNKTTNVEIKKAEISKDQIYGTDSPILDYASDEVIIFHGYFGLFVYSLEESKIINSLDLEYINCDKTQGDNYCEVTISDDGKIVQLHNLSSEDMYVFSLDDNSLIKKKYAPLDNEFKLIETPKSLIYSDSIISSEAVEFENGDIGYLSLKDDKIYSLEYIRSNREFKIFS